MENDKASSKQFSQNAEIGELKRELVKVFYSRLTLGSK
jgi:hypothetical protein